VRITRTSGVAALALVSAIALSSCASNEPAPGTDSGSDAAEEQLSGTLDGSGASSQASAQEAWVAGFQGAQGGVTVNYTPEGSGPGREAFLAGSIQFAGSDRAFNDEEIAAGGFGACASDAIIELPAYISPIAVIFNLEGVDTLNLDAPTLSNIFLGNITTWNDPAIADQNPDATLPDTAISPVHRSDDSGTTENFTDYLNAVAPDVWTAEPDGVWPLQTGEAADGTTGMVDAVSGGEGTIGYADFSRAGDLGVVSVLVGEEYAAPSAEGAAAFVAASPLAEGRSEGDLAFDLDRTLTDSGVYPVALVSYLIGCEEYEDANDAALVAAYFEYVASEDGQQAAADNAGSAPISDDLRTQVDDAIGLIQQ
jgi:phosphate transport system substrate-binding protein